MLARQRGKNGRFKTSNEEIETFDQPEVRIKVPFRLGIFGRTMMVLIFLMLISPWVFIFVKKNQFSYGAISGVISDFYDDNFFCARFINSTKSGGQIEKKKDF